MLSAGIQEKVGEGVTMHVHAFRNFRLLSRMLVLVLAFCGWGVYADVFANDGIRGLHPAEVAWEKRRSAPDVYYAAIYGDPAKSAPYAFRVRAQAGHRLAPHTHRDERTVTVLSGTYWTGVGESFDDARLQPYPAGSFYVIPAGIPHFSAVLDGEVEFQETGVGPSSHDLVAD
jgi:quercetin dioxygenase-like cupin family protein